MQKMCLTKVRFRLDFDNVNNNHPTHIVIILMHTGFTINERKCKYQISSVIGQNARNFSRHVALCCFVFISFIRESEKEKNIFHSFEVRLCCRERLLATRQTNGQTKIMKLQLASPIKYFFLIQLDRKMFFFLLLHIFQFNFLVSWAAWH